MLGYLNKVKLKTLFFLILGLITCFLTVQVVLKFHQENPQVEKDHLIILWWTPFITENERIISCFNKHTCRITKNRDYNDHTSLAAYLFYGSRFNISDLPLPKNHTKWAILHEESPRNEAVFLHEDTWDVFDITSTFSRNSDMPITLQYLSNLSIITDPHYVIKVQDKNKYLNSIAPVLYLQSNCDTPNDRDAYILELMKFIEIDSYGACLKNKKFPQDMLEVPSLDLYNEKLLKFVAKYKFVIAFENAICDDYITEKLWRPLIVGSIPIYFGSPIIEDWLPNTDSAILVKNFDNPKNLAQFIKNINHDDNLYRSFLKHKFGIISNNLLKSKLKQHSISQEHPIESFECFVCTTIHENTFKKKKSVKSVYDCAEPKAGNSWEYHWKFGKCQSQVLKELAEKGGQYKGQC